MAFRRTQAPGDLDADGVRKYTEEQLLRIQRATAEMEKAYSGRLDTIEADIGTIQSDIGTIQSDIGTIQSDITSIQTDLTKERHNQHARVCLTGAAQTGVPDGIRTKVNFNTVSFDASSIWDNTNKWFKPTVAGIYRFSWSLYMRNDANSAFLTILQVNGIDVCYGNYLPNYPATEVMTGGTDLVSLNGSTDTVNVVGYIVGGSARIFDAGSTLTYFTCELVRAA